MYSDRAGWQEVRDHPILKNLLVDMAIFLCSTMHAFTGLQKVSGKPTIPQAQTAILHHIETDRHVAHVATFGCLEIRSSLCTSIQRVRCYPFPNDKWREGTNPMQFVFIIPPKQFSGRKFSDFTLTDSAQRRGLWVGKVARVLLFHSTLLSKRDAAGEQKRVRLPLAMVSCLYDFKLPQAQGPFQKEVEGRLFYESVEPWTIVVPVRNILSRVPLLRCYLDGGSNATIPRSLYMHKQAYFPYGRADGSGNPGNGSAVWEFNPLMWKWGRPSPGVKDGRD